MIPYDLSPPKTPPTHRVRRWLLAVVLWAFGISTTVFLIGNWGHTTTGDHETLAESARTALDAEVVTERVTEWLGDGLATAGGLPADTIRAAAAEIQASPQAARAIDGLVAEAITILLAEPGTTSNLDVAETLTPLVPLVEAELAEHGFEVPGGAIAASLAEIGPIDLATEELDTAATIARQSRALLSRVLAIALAAMLLTGAAAVAISEDRLAMVRTLAMRVAVSGFSFIVVFSAAAWALDPERGRSPLLGSGGVLLESNQHTFWAAAVPAAVVFAVAAWFVWRRSRFPKPAMARSIARSSGEEPTTQELAAV
jgi:hypothetical protein